MCIICAACIVHRCVGLCLCVNISVVCCSGSVPQMNCHLCEFPSHMGFGVARWLGQWVQVKKSCSESQRLIGSDLCVSHLLKLSVCLQPPSPPPLSLRDVERRSRQCRWSCEMDLHCSIIDLKLWPFSLWQNSELTGRQHSGSGISTVNSSKFHLLLQRQCSPQT